MGVFMRAGEGVPGGSVWKFFGKRISGGGKLIRDPRLSLEIYTSLISYQ